jgi:CRISPR/Cas system-associated endoribonuclease Cas2
MKKEIKYMRIEKNEIKQKIDKIKKRPKNSIIFCQFCNNKIGDSKIGCKYHLVKEKPCCNECYNNKR